MFKKRVRTICNNCGKTFILKNNMIMNKRINNDVTKKFFSCPRCNKEYIIQIKNKEIIKNDIEINKIQDEIKNKYKFEPRELSMLLYKLDKLRERNSKLTEILKNIYGRGE